MLNTHVTQTSAFKKLGWKPISTIRGVTWYRFAKPALFIRTVASNMTSNGGSFKYPKAGTVDCPDWDPMPICGGGIHGCALHHDGHQLISWSRTIYLLMEAELNEMVEVDGDKVKVPRANVLLLTTNRADLAKAVAKHVQERVTRQLANI